MDIVADVALVVVGVALMVAVFDSALRTFVLPRGVSTTLVRIVFIPLRRVFDVLAREGRSYEARELRAREPGVAPRGPSAPP